MKNLITASVSAFLLMSGVAKSTDDIEKVGKNFIISSSKEETIDLKEAEDRLYKFELIHKYSNFASNMNKDTEDFKINYLNDGSLGEDIVKVMSSWNEEDQNLIKEMLGNKNKHCESPINNAFNSISYLALCSVTDKNEVLSKIFKEFFDLKEVKDRLYKFTEDFKKDYSGESLREDIVKVMNSLGEKDQNFIKEMLNDTEKFYQSLTNSAFNSIVCLVTYSVRDKNEVLSKIFKEFFDLKEAEVRLSKFTEDFKTDYLEGSLEEDIVKVMSLLDKKDQNLIKAMLRDIEKRCYHSINDTFNLIAYLAVCSAVEKDEVLLKIFAKYFSEEN